MMNPQERYIAQLQQAAQEGTGTLSQRVKARLWEGDGPYLTQEEDSPLDVVIRAYRQVEAKTKLVFLQLFLDTLRQFTQNWLWEQPISEAQATMAGYALSFFENIDLSPKAKESVMVVVNGFSDSKERFERLVTPPRDQSTMALYHQIERWIWECSKGSEGHEACLSKLWKDHARPSQEIVKQNGRLLKAMAEANPELIDGKKLFTFFQQSRCLAEEERTSLLENTFLRVGRFMAYEDLPQLIHWLHEQLTSNLAQPLLLNQEPAELQQFFNILGFIFRKDIESLHQLKADLDEALKRRAQEKKERRRHPTVEKSLKIQQFNESLSQNQHPRKVVPFHREKTA